MDEDLLYTNKFIRDTTVHGGYGMTEELRQHRLREHQQQQSMTLTTPREEDLLDTDIMKTNPVLDDDGELKELDRNNRLKEKRTILAIDSTQRNVFRSVALSTVAVSTFQKYVLPANWSDFQTIYSWLQADPTDPPSDTTDYLTAPNTNANNSAMADKLYAAAAIATYFDTYTRITVLNSYLMSSPASNPSGYWRPFYYDTADSTTKVILYDEQNPSSYSITLTNRIKHVKSVRLISTEIPNTINNITQRNNIIALMIRDKATDTPIDLESSVSPYRFIMIKLDVGCYTLANLITHMQSKINEQVNALTSLSDVFTVTRDTSSGKITIAITDALYEFHLKFYSRLVYLRALESDNATSTSVGNVTEFSRDLWYMLGFPWPYEVNSDSSDRYTSSLTNEVSFGVHSELEQGHSDNDIFDRAQAIAQASSPYTAIYTDLAYLTNTTKYDVVHHRKPYRFPSIDHKYIYMIIKGLKNIDHYYFNGSILPFTDGDIFAKVQMNADVGSIAFNTYVSNPLIFLDIIEDLNKLEITWVDESGALVDFGGVDHSFTLEVIHYVTQLNVNNYSTTIGMIDTKSYPDYKGMD